ncbi:hypothetical protein [Rugosimonospora africana]|uniref:Uncharacterized protein n=1 Tax=Rugosimonospora africana TaxID=556532 RepID=A0A8J3R0Q5_9ACTN|nr:hypothetical protein [Rugosimonospora africana]GIH19672.1 hypothetical protein Raf01_78440 [Rugosimonospora africana]
MTVGRYSASDIQVIEFDESVRTRPTMYFGAGRGSPDLATRVLEGVLAHALHPAARVAAVHTLQVKTEIIGDLAFVVSDDRADALDDPGVRLGYYGSMLGPARWVSAAAAALSSRTVAEVWRDGIGLRQELAGLRPISEPRNFVPEAEAGTRVSFDLDNAYFRRGIAANLASLDLHGPHCSDVAGPGQVTLVDLRDRGNPTTSLYR